MIKFSMIQFEALKKEVINAAGITSITPADCKMLSNVISKKTEQRISETTLKRIYGFAFSKFKPSLFTIDVLARFCNYTGWDDFCQKHERYTGVADADLNWDTLRHNAAKVTQFTNQTLKNRSGIPYNQTIKRAFINKHLDDFIASGCSGTVIAAPAGYGKTIALCHWMDEKTDTEQLTEPTDIFLFFSSTALMSVLLSGRDISYWILELLGYSTSKDISVLFDESQQKKGNFYLIIDGFDEHMIKSEQYHVILNQIIDLFSFHQGNTWFKLILTMRSSTWVNYRHEFESGINKWYTNFKPDDDCVNVPLFNVDEIMELCRNINPSVQTFIAMNVAESFNHPLYLQFYYKQHQEGFSLNNVTHLSIYDLISMFILNKIYLGPHSTERILLLKELIDNMDLESSVYHISKIKVKEILKEYSQAYFELISIGFLREINESSSYLPNIYIAFGNDNFLGYSIAKNLMYHFGDRFNAEIVQNINKLFANSPHKLTVLKWCVIQAIKTGQQNSFAMLTDVQLTSNQKSDLIIFLGDLLENESEEQKRNKTLLLYFRQDFSVKMFDYFFGIELINATYKKTLNTLLRFELSSRKKILVYTALALWALISLNLKELMTLLIKLRSFDVLDYQYFAINPLNCLDALYHYLRYGIIKKKVLAELTQLYFNPPEDDYSLKNSASNDMLYLLGAYTLLITDNPKKSLRFLRMVSNTYESKKHDNEVSQYRFFKDILLGDLYYKLGDYEKTSELYYKISDSFKKSENKLTPFMKSAFIGLKIKVLLHSPRVDNIINEMKALNIIVDGSGDKLSRLNIISLLLKAGDVLDNYPNFKKQLQYDLGKLVRENDLYMNELLLSRSLV